MKKKKVHARNKMRKQSLDSSRRHKAGNAEWFEYLKGLKVEEKRRNKWLKIRKFFGLVSVKEYGPMFFIFFCTVIAFIFFLCGGAYCCLGLFNDPYIYGGIGIDKILIGGFMMWLFGQLFYYLCRESWTIIVVFFKEKRAKKKEGKS